MVMYDVVLDSGSTLTVLASNIQDALLLAEAYGDTVIDCKFIKKIERLRIDSDLLVKRERF